MVWDQVLLDAGLRPTVYACLGCLQKRLQRPLTLQDFVPLPINRLAWAGAGKLEELLKLEQKDEQESKST